jgi:CRP-like cAMP-binding protein
MNRGVNKSNITQSEMTCEFCHNERCLIKKNCSPESIKILSDKKNNIRCNKGKSIILEGTPVMGIYFIYEGKVKITVTGENNKEHIVRMACNSHVIGHMAKEGEYYPIGATALDDCIICFINNETLNELLLKNPDFTIAMMLYYSEELRKAELRIKYFSQMTVTEKVIYSLVYLADTFGRSADNGELNVLVSRQEIADIAGTTAEQVSREMSILTKDSILETKSKKINIKDFQYLLGIVKNYYPYNYE